MRHAEAPGVGSRATSAALLALQLGCATAAATPPVFFDDFSHADTAAMGATGWQLRDAAGHPGVPGATWSPAAVELVPDPDRAGNRLLRLRAHTDGRPEGTVQAQVCHARKPLHGTYAARVRFSDQPDSGAAGDPVVQAFYATSPLAHDFDPDFSEIDWEYLPSGGWGSGRTRLYAIAWQTVRIEPWQAHNAAAQVFGRHGGWHELVVQVETPGAGATSRWFVDGREVARHGGRNHPVTPMTISFSLWFSPGGLLGPSAQARSWTMDVDWVWHAAGRIVAPAAVHDEVSQLRARGVAWRDEVPRPLPPLPDRCDF